MQQRIETNDIEIAECASRYFIDFACSRCGYRWCEADEVADATDCPNCEAQEQRPVTVIALTGRSS